MGMSIVLPEERAARNPQKDQEIDRHVQVIRHGGGGDQRAVHMEGVRQGSKVHAAADIGSRHHGAHAGKARDGPVQQDRGQQRTGYGTRRADQENQQETPGFPPDPADVGIQKQQRNGQGHGVAPGEVVEHRRAGGNHVQVYQGDRQDQRQDRPADFGRPPVFLLQPDGKRGAGKQNGQQRPVVFRSDQGLHICFLPMPYSVISLAILP